jgi:TonB-dependent receptor
MCRGQPRARVHRLTWLVYNKREEQIKTLSTRISLRKRLRIVWPFLSQDMRRVSMIALASACLTANIGVHAQVVGNASLEGTVSDVDTNTPIAGARVQIDGVAVSSDANGTFAFKTLSAGNHLVVINAAGHRKLERTVTLIAGANKVPAIALEATAVELSDVSVSAAMSESQTKFDDKASADTLTETISDAALKNPNAQSTADYMKNISGVSVSSGANGSSTVSVRGIDQRMLRITVDGQRQGGNNNPLDSIPAEVVQSLEVTKTFTPDMEADAVGGVININTGGTIIKDAYLQGRHQITSNTLESRPGTRNSLTVGQPYNLFAGEHNASVLATVSLDDSYSNRERVSNLREWTSQIAPAGSGPYTGLAIPVLTLPVIEATQEHRQRSGLVLNSDARFGDLAVFWRSNLSRDWARRDRRINDTDPSSGTPQYLTPSSGTFSGVPLSRRDQQQTTQRDAFNVSFGGKSKLNGNDLDATVALVSTHENEPHTLDTGFLSDHTYRVSYDLSQNAYAPMYSYIDETVPLDTTSANDPAHYLFDYLKVTRSTVDESDGSAKVNFKINLENWGNYLKFGGKLEQLKRNANVDSDVFDAGAPLAMTGLVGASQVDMQTTPYRFGPVPSASAVSGLLSTMPTAFQQNTTQTRINSTSGDYSVTETLWALYGMGKFRINSKWSALGGVRVEGTQVTSTGEQMLLDGIGQLQGFDPARGSNNYVEVLPGLHLRYEPETGMLYRSSITRSMSRPNIADIAPYRTLSFIDHRSRIGAPDLKPYLATNFDLSLDKYSDKYGLVSLAVFYKKIDHFITDAQYATTIGNLGEFIEFKRINGESASAMGGEFSWQSPTWTLPLKLGRASVETNYNYNHGVAKYPDRPGETFPLPRQVDNQASIKLHDTHGPLTLDASVSHRSGWWEDEIARGFDNYIISAWDAEISGAYKIGKNGRITAGINNLLNRPTRHYAGLPSRMNDSQRNGVDMNLGVQWKL